jgi:hypothetical protein
MVIGYLIVVVLAALALTRLPSALAGRNLPVVLSAVTIVAAFALITPAVYAALDRLVPIPNAVDLVAKLLLFTGLLLAGSAVARAYDAPRTQRLVSGLPGAAVFIVLMLAEVAVFAVVHTGRVAPDLAGDLWNPLVRVYSTLATAYPAYIALLLVPLVRRGLSSGDLSARVTSRFLLVGFLLALLRFVVALVTLVVPAAYYPGQVVSGVAAIAVAAGLACAFFARVGRERRTQRQFT